MKYFQFCLLVVVLGITTTLQAQETQTYTIGSETIEYTEIFTDIEHTSSYYNGDTLVLTITDTEKDDTPNAWFFYRDDLSVQKELRDTDNDGKPDIFFDLDVNENVTNSTGEGLKNFEPEIQQIPETTSQANESNSTIEEKDYAGDLEDIKKLAGESGGWMPWLLALLLIGSGGYFWWKRKSHNTSTS